MMAGHISIADPITQQAFHVASELDERLADVFDELNDNGQQGDAEKLYERHQAWVMMTQNVLSLGVGEECLWMSEANGMDELTTEFCLNELRDALRIDRLTLNILDQRNPPALKLQEGT